MKNFFLIFGIILISVIFGCSHHRSPVAITGPAPVQDGSVAYTQANLHLCSMAGNYNGPLIINSQDEYDAYVRDNNVYSGLTYTPSPYPVDYAHKTLLGYIFAFVGSNPFGFEFTSITTDGTTTTVNAKTTDKFCPSGTQYLESCRTYFVVTDKITTPVVYSTTNVMLDCDGNTTAVLAPLVCVSGAITFTALAGQGYFSDSRENIVVTTQAEYDAFLAAHYTGVATPAPIDFNKKALIAVFMGLEPNLCYATELQEITLACGSFNTPGSTITDRPIMTVKIKETYPACNAVCGQIVTRPAELVLIDRLAGGTIPAGALTGPVQDGWLPTINFEYNIVDQDNDGFQDRDEITAHTDPCDAASHP